MRRIDTDELLNNLMAIGFPVLTAAYILYDQYQNRHISVYESGYSLLPILVVIVLLIIFVGLNKLIFRGQLFFVIILVLVALMGAVILRPYPLLRFWPLLNLVPAGRSFLMPLIRR